MNLSITHRSPYSPPVEFVERKGVGHPDTICDRLAEDLSRLLASDYLRHTGMVQPFNVDKAVLAAGTVDIGFGGGTHTKASKLVLVGKADFSFDWKPDPEALAVEFKTRLLDLLPDAGPEAFQVEVWLSQSSIDLATVVKARPDDVPLANDTSFAAVSLPRSPLEEMVHRVEERLNDDDYRAAVPIGRDIKVMGARIDASVRLTVASPVMAGAVQNRAQYDEVVTEVRDSVSRVATDIFGDYVDVAVNQADKDDSAYLTITGNFGRSGGRRTGRQRQPFRRAHHALPPDEPRSRRRKEPGRPRGQDVSRRRRRHHQTAARRVGRLRSHDPPPQLNRAPGDRSASGTHGRRWAPR